MDKYKLLREAISEKAFREEPLAMAILSCLERDGLVDHVELIKAFDAVIDNKLEIMMKEIEANNHVWDDQQNT